MFSRAPPTGWLLPPPRPIQPSQTPRCLPQLWYLWGICFGVGCPTAPAQPHARGKGLPGPSASTMHRHRKGRTHTQTHRYTCRHTQHCGGPIGPRESMSGWSLLLRAPEDLPCEPEACGSETFLGNYSHSGPCLPGGPHRGLLKHGPRQRIGGVCLTPVAPLSLLLSKQHRQHSYQK